MKTMKTTSLLAASALLISATALPAARTLVHWGESGETGYRTGEHNRHTSNYLHETALRSTQRLVAATIRAARSHAHLSMRRIQRVVQLKSERTAPVTAVHISGGPLRSRSHVGLGDGVHTLSSRLVTRITTSPGKGSYVRQCTRGYVQFLLEDSAGQWHISQSFSDSLVQHLWTAFLDQHPA